MRFVDLDNRAARADAGTFMPMRARMTAMSLPMKSWFIAPRPRGPGCFANTRFSIWRSAQAVEQDGALAAPSTGSARSATLATTNTSFSSTQMMLLSVDAPRTMSRAALSMCAVSSTTTGGLPGPAQMARLPLAIAAFTTAPPPVTTSRRMPGWRITSCADSMVGFDRHVTTFGRPARRRRSPC